MNQKYFNPMFI